MKEKMREQGREEKNEEKREAMILLRSVSRKIRQTNCLAMIRKKSPSDELFVRKFRILPVFFFFT